MRKIYVNMRSISNRHITGVQRYGREITERLPDLIPLDAPSRLKDGIPGHIWDQITLPLRCSGTLWSPSNLGPLLHKNQVVTIHDLSPFDNPDWFSRKYINLNNAIQPILVQTAEHIITVSEYSKSRIISNFGINPKKISVTYLAADENFKPLSEASKEIAIKEHKWPEKYILCVGSLEKRKNLSTLFEAWDLWQDRPKFLKLLVVGGQGKIFSGIGFESLPKDVLLLGRLEDDDLYSLYSCATAFVYPSLYEGFGLPVLEAMASGVPVITSDATSIPEVVGGAAILVDPRNPLSILNAIKAVLDDKSLREEAIGNGIERSKLFSWDKTAKETWEILNIHGRK